MLGFEFHRVDVLILLGRVLGVLDGAVGPLPEPLGMLADVGMIGRALEGDVERDLDALPGGFRDQVLEILERAEGGMDGLVAALLGADGPGAADVVGLRGGVVVAALAKAAADGVNGRQVEHVEAHFGDVGQAGFAVPEGAMRARLRGAGTREHFVPGAEAGLGAIDGDGEFRLEAGCQAAVRIAARDQGELLVEREFLALGHGQIAGQSGSPIGESDGVAFGRAGGRGGHELARRRAGRP